MKNKYRASPALKINGLVRPRSAPRSKAALPRRASRRRVPRRPTLAPGVSRTSCPVSKTQDSRTEKSHGAATGRRARCVSRVAAVHRARPPTLRARSATERKPEPAAGLGSVDASSQKHRACAVRRHHRAIHLHGGKRHAVSDHGLHPARELLCHAKRVAAQSRRAPRHHRAPVGQQRESAAIFARENLRRAVAELEDQLVYGTIDIVAALEETVNRT